MHTQKYSSCLAARKVLLTGMSSHADHRSCYKHTLSAVVCRHEMYPGYKGQRPPTPEPITEAVKQLRDLIRVMGIQEIIVPGIEADDVIGTVAKNALKEGLQVAIASPDKVSTEASMFHYSHDQFRS